MENTPNNPLNCTHCTTQQHDLPHVISTSELKEALLNFSKENNFTSLLPPKETINVSLEGIIGCGKTSFLNFLQELDIAEIEGISLLAERVTEWQNFNDFNLLELFYKKREKWSFVFQHVVLYTMIQRLLDSKQAKIRLMERSPMSSIEIFAKNLVSTKCMADIEFTALKAWFDMVDKQLGISLQLDAIIYIKTPPALALKRLKSRGRKEEKNIDLTYQTKLEELHEKWLTSKDSPFKGKLFILDGTKTGRELNQEYLRAVAWLHTLKY